MKGMTNWAISLLWRSAYARENRKFLKSLYSVRDVQEKLLFDLLRKNADSSFGREHRFHLIKSIDDYQKAVPLMSYDEYLPYITRIADGEDGVLTSEPVLLFEPSSGSTAASKFIPYTKSLKEEFQRGLKPWIYNMYTRIKGLSRGKSYWSISPATHEKKKTSCGIPIGFEEDSEYFGFFEKFLIDRMFAVPAEVKSIQDMNAFQYTTLLFLLKEKSLAMISVWNPTFLTIILDNFNIWIETLVSDIEHGTINPPGTISPSFVKLLETKNKRDKKRANEIRMIISDKASGGKTLFERIWPSLKLISCWTESGASFPVHRVRKLFPNVMIQGKGLIATEGFVSFPLVGRNGSVLTIRSHFFEFIEYNGYEQGNDRGKIKLASELEMGKTYSVVLTTSGGFYRYKLHDLIRVIDFINRCPMVLFIGRDDAVSDCVGEKLNENHVSALLIRLFDKYTIASNFFMVAPELDESSTYSYILFIEPADSPEGLSCDFITLLAEMELELQKNYHYEYSRKLGQLGPCRLFVVDKENGNATYFRVCLSRGQKAGDIKPATLSRWTGWSREFSGRFIIAKTT